jgi:cytochrome c-type biogenesis protein
MGTSVLLVSLAAAFAGSAVGRVLRARTGLIMRAGGVVMVLAGLWVIVYGLAEILPSYGVTALNEVLFSSSRLQGSISSAITGWGTPVLVAGLSLVVVTVALVFVLARRDSQLDNFTTTEPATAISPSVATQDVLDAVRKATTGR